MRTWKGLIATAIIGGTIASAPAAAHVPDECLEWLTSTAQAMHDSGPVRGAYIEQDRASLDPYSDFSWDNYVDYSAHLYGALIDLTGNTFQLLNCTDERFIKVLKRLSEISQGR